MDACRQDGNKLIWEMNHETLCLEPWGNDSLRVRATRDAALHDDLPGALLAAPPLPAHIEIGERAVIRNGNIQAEVSVKGIVRFTNVATGTLLLEEVDVDMPVIVPNRLFRSAGGDLYRIETRFEPQSGERFYGMGQHQHGLLDQKGAVIELLQRNTEVCIPFLVSSRGYGFLWNNPAVGRAELGTNGTHWVAEASRQMDYWVTTATDYAGIMENYADATGHAPMLPEFAAGFWQCRLRYKTQDELLSVAREYKKRGLPLSVIVVDYFHWTMMGDFIFDPECWPDPAAMVHELKEMGVELMVSIWPSFNVNSINHAEMDKQGFFIGNERGFYGQKSVIDTYPAKATTFYRFYDATNPQARRFVWEKVRDNYYRMGIRVFWLDACEPEIRPLDHDNLRYHLGQGMEVGCIYPLLHEQGFYEGMKAEGESDIITLCRSAWAGSQRYAAAVWSGDILSTFEVLQQQVRAGLNIGMSGIPWWTTDIGGFNGGDITTPYFRELIVRWFQYGVFCPLFRLHGYRRPNLGYNYGSPNEVWSFGDEAYAIIKDLLFLRERLRPYIMKQMRLASEKGTPVMRPLFFDFPDDRVCADVEDQFMFGPDLMVAPVLEQGAVQRRVYFPMGAAWTDAWTGKTYQGGHETYADAPLDRIPLYLRDGAQLPIRG
jgi:alpha-D-xyloside xylohydrolase